MLTALYMLAQVMLLMLLLGSVGCTSQPYVPPECPAPPAPPAWMMEQQPSLLPLLDKIISPSEAS